MRDLAANIICILVTVLVANDLYYKRHLEVNFGILVTMTLLFGLLYLAAQIFHASVVFVPFGTGIIPWQHSGCLLFATLVCAFISMILYVRQKMGKR
jgi:drug/metabolite transporter (DMT)-like permease